MSLSPKFIYFDLDDTLLDHKQAEQKALYDVFHHFDFFSASDVDQLVDTYHRVNTRQWGLYSRDEVTREQLQRNRFELTLRKLGLDDTRFGEVGTQYMHYYQDHWQWLPDAEEAFQIIRNDFPVGILTNGFAETQKKKFKKFDLYNKANHLVISEETGAMKPSPLVFEHATKLTGCKPDEILYVGDSYASDVVGGTGFGWKVAWFTRNENSEQRNKAYFVFDNFKDLVNTLNVRSQKS